MTSVIRNHITNPLKDLKASTAKECSCRQKYNCPLAEKCLSKCFVYHAQVDMSDSNQTKSYYGTCEKISNNVTTTTPLLLEIKINKKVQNSLREKCSNTELFLVLIFLYSD